MRKPAAPVTRIGAPASGRPSVSRSVPSMAPGSQLREQCSRNESQSPAEGQAADAWEIPCYCRSTVKRLIEYPSAPPMKTSDKKWADRESLENPTSAAMPYAAYGTQR